VIKENVAGKVTIWEGGGNLLKCSRANNNPVNKALEALEILALQVARAALLTVLPVHVTVVKVVVLCNVGVEKQVVHGMLHYVPVKKVKLVGWHCYEGAPKAFCEVYELANGLCRWLILRVYSTLLLKSATVFHLCVCVWCVCV